jgi:hypothetical protein
MTLRTADNYTEASLLASQNRLSGTRTAGTRAKARRIAKKLAQPGVWLWVVQGLLAAVFLMTGGSKLVLPLEMLKGPVALPGLFLRFLGAAEVSGAFGLILPGLLLIRPMLTPLAAAGLVIIMTGATVLTAVFMDPAMAVGPLVLGLLAAFVAYGRVRLAPQRRSSQPAVA